MKTIIAGGRNYKFTKEDIEFLNSIKDEISEVVSGKARGADNEGEDWAKSNNIPVKEFPAKWGNLNAREVFIKTNSRGYSYNSLAGFQRNEEMAKYADCLIIFSGGSGTEHMYKIAKENGLKIYDRRK